MSLNGNGENKVKQIIIATSNMGKVKEMINAFEGLPVELKTLRELKLDCPEPVEDGKTFKENSFIKAKYYQEKTGMACLADDSGLEVEKLNNEPGVYSARYSGEHNDGKNNAKLVAELKKLADQQSPAAYQCALTFVDDDGTVISAQGFCRGKVKPDPVGDGGFGYDPYFYIDDKSMAQLTVEEKHKISHRGAALDIMRDKLREYLRA